MYNGLGFTTAPLRAGRWPIRGTEQDVTAAPFDRNGTNTMLNKFKIPIAVTLGFAAVSLALIQVGKSHSPEACADRIVDCLNDRDADCLSQQVSDSELSVYQCNREELPAFFSDYVFPSFPEGKIVVLSSQESPQGPSQSFFEIGIPQGGWSASLDVHPVDGHVGSPTLLSSMILASGLARHKLDADTMPEDSRDLFVMHEIATKDAPSLERLGIHGFLRSFEEGLLSFSAWKAKTEDQLIRLKHRNPPKPVR